jgi:hypothetical protein
MYIWNTWPICQLIERLWKAQRPFMALDAETPVSHYDLETMSMFERTLNVGHVGSFRPIATGLMNPCHVGLALVETGFPTFFPELVIPTSSTEPPYILDKNWPRHARNRTPMVASRRAQQLTYGDKHYEVSSSSTLHDFNYYKQPCIKSMTMEL